MNRIIKFRAYHKAEKKIYDVDILSFLSGGAFLLGAKSGQDTLSGDGNFVIKAPTDGKFCKWDEFGLMQFTGLLDKNGKEIYEGDIIELTSSVGTKHISCLMWWGKDQDIHEAGYGYGSLCWSEEDIGKDHLRAIEVIGNIYENPKLLKESSGTVI